MSGFTKQDYYDSPTNVASGTISSTNTQAGQSFTTSTTYTISRVDLELWRLSGNIIGTVVVSIKTVDGSGHPTGPDLAHGTLDGSLISASWNWIIFLFDITYELQAGTKYAIVIRASAADSSNKLLLREGNNGGYSEYSGGDKEWTTNNGTNWTTNNYSDFMFKTYSGISINPQLDDIEEKIDEINAKLPEAKTG